MIFKKAIFKNVKWAFSFCRRVSTFYIEVNQVIYLLIFFSIFNAMPVPAFRYCKITYSFNETHYCYSKCIDSSAASSSMIDHLNICMINGYFPRCYLSAILFWMWMILSNRFISVAQANSWMTKFFLLGWQFDKGRNFISLCGNGTW